MTIELPTERHWPGLTILLVTAAIVAALLWPLDVVVVDSRNNPGQVKPAPRLAYSSTRTAPDIVVLQMPIISFLFYLTAGWRSDFRLSVLAAPVAISAKTARSDQVPPELRSRLAEARLRDQRHERLVQVLVADEHGSTDYNTLIKQLERSGDRLRIIINGKVFREFTRTGPYKIEGSYREWTGFDARMNRTRIVTDGQSIQIQMNDPLGPVFIQSVDRRGLVYLLNSPKMAASPGGAQSTRLKTSSSESPTDLLACGGAAHLTKLAADPATPPLRIVFVKYTAPGTLPSDYELSVKKQYHFARDIFVQSGIGNDTLELISARIHPEDIDGVGSITAKDIEFLLGNTIRWSPYRYIGPDAVQDFRTSRLYRALDRRRRSENADLVVFFSPVALSDDSIGPICGFASAIEADSTRRFALIDSRSSECDITTAAHEIGHLLGAHHDTFDDPQSDSNGRGWREALGFGTYYGDIMATNISRRYEAYSELGRKCDGLSIGRASRDSLAVIKDAVRQLPAVIRDPNLRGVRFARIPRECPPLPYADQCILGGRFFVLFRVGTDEVVGGPNCIGPHCVDKVAQEILAQSPLPSRITVGGFTEISGGDELNFDLSVKRSNVLARSISHYAGSRSIDVNSCAYGEKMRFCGGVPSQPFSAERRAEAIVSR